jgi:hypothetical protein
MRQPTWFADGNVRRSQYDVCDGCGVRPLSKKSIPTPGPFRLPVAEFGIVAPVGRKGVEQLLGGHT